jgi:hypothetical protein
MKKIDLTVPDELKTSFKENTEVLDKFIKFSFDCKEDDFIEIFGKEKGSKLYHNIFFATFNKDMPKFLRFLEADEKNMIYYHILYRI